MNWKMSILLSLLIATANATATVVEYPAIGTRQMTLTLYSSTDIDAFSLVIRDFQALTPGVAVRYVLLDAAPLYSRFLDETAAARPQADLLLSTSMDLQTKLVNDGYAAPHDSANARALPSWARWRNEAFGFTFEPAVMVFNRKAMHGREVPASRTQLLEMLKREPAVWKGRVGSYDIEHSSVGYLLASQDMRQSSEFGALIEAFGDADLKVEEHSAALLNRLESGELAIGYNVLGSYARARVRAGAPLIIVHPQEYTLAVLRTAVLPKNAPHADVAHRFLDYLLSLRGQRLLATRSHLSAVRPEIVDSEDRPGIAGDQVGILRPITLGPGLLVYLDTQKRRQLLNSWRGIIGEKRP